MIVDKSGNSSNPILLAINERYCSTDYYYSNVGTLGLVWSINAIAA